MKYTSQQYMVMAISFGGALSITPFALFRLLNGDWLIGAVDSGMVLCMMLLGIITYRSPNFKYTGVMLSIVGLAGMTSVVYIKGPDLVYWAYPTIVSLYFFLRPKQAIILTLITTVILSFTLYSKMEFLQFLAVVITLLVNNIFAFLFANRMRQQRDKLYELIRKDSLTGVGNRRALDEKIEELISMYQRSGQVFSIVIFDIDHFKLVNDNYGHAMGDKVLVNLAAIIDQRIRITDNLYRYGGEEFVAVLLSATIDSARTVAEEFRLLIESSELIEDYQLTVSLGVAEYSANETATGYINRADQALYAAKESGRNRTCVAKN